MRVVRVTQGHATGNSVIGACKWDVDATISSSTPLGWTTGIRTRPTTLVKQSTGSVIVHVEADMPVGVGSFKCVLLCDTRLSIRLPGQR
jgi:hypothetical protein